MTQPLLSICIPLDHETLLHRQALEELLFVKDLEFEVEVIIIGSDSSAGTEELVQSYAQRLPIRYLGKEATGNLATYTSAAFRAARGSYALHLAANARLVPEVLTRHIAYLRAHEELVCLHVPCLLWDEVAGRTIKPMYHLEAVRTFPAEQALDCFNFIVSCRVLPELAIYRTEVLHKLLLYPHRLCAGLVMLFRAFRYGSVCFHPDSYYRLPVHSGDGEQDSTEPQHAYEQQLNHLDQDRGALESALLSVLQELAPLPLPTDLRGQALQMINDFLQDRIVAASELSLAQRDFIAAHELRLRSFLWRSEVNREEITQWESTVLPLVAIQSAIEVLRPDSTLAGIILCGFADAERLKLDFRQFSPPVEVLLRSEEDALSREDREQFLYLVEHPDCRDRLVAGGLLPGRVLCFVDLVDQFRILPRTFSN